MILIICFIFLISCFIKIEKNIDYQSYSIDYEYYLSIWPFNSCSFLSIYRDELDIELYCISIQIDFGFLKYKEKIDSYCKDYIDYELYKTVYYNLYYEHCFVFNREFYNRYLKD